MVRIKGLSLEKQPIGWQEKWLAEFLTIFCVIPRLIKRPNATELLSDLLKLKQAATKQEKIPGATFLNFSFQSTLILLNLQQELYI